MSFIRFGLIILSILALLILTVSSLPATDGFHNGFSESVGKSGEPYFKAFISYRRSTSKHLAWLIKILLSERNVPAYLDVEDLRAGYWDTQLTTAIEQAPNFIFILSNGTLDRCIGDTNYTDVVHQEIKTAIDTKRNIIPVFDDFTMPSAKFSPEITEMMRFQGVLWNHSLINGSITKLVGYLTNNATT